MTCASITTCCVDQQEVLCGFGTTGFPFLERSASTRCLHRQGDQVSKILKQSMNSVRTLIVLHVMVITLCEASKEEEDERRQDFQIGGILEVQYCSIPRKDALNTWVRAFQPLYDLRWNMLLRLSHVPRPVRFGLRIVLKAPSVTEVLFSSQKPATPLN